MSNTQPPAEKPDHQPQPPGQPGAGGLPRYSGSQDQIPQQADRQTPPKPQSIRLAVTLMWVGAAISLVSLIASLMTMAALETQIREQLQQTGQNITEDTVSTAASFAIGTAVVGSVIAILLWIWMAWKNGQGRRWARIVATILGGINVLSTLYTVFMGNQAMVATILTVLNLLLAVVILILLWRRESSEFYAAASAR